MVVVCEPPMSKGFPLLLGAGPLPEQVMRHACEAIAQSCGCALQSYECGESPQKVLASTTSTSGLVRLCGDAARFHNDGGSWLEAIADWRRPVLLLVPGEDNGSISGSGPAYAALCRELKVPLMGLVQLHGGWDRSGRRQDGQPWRGWIPAADHPDHNDAVATLGLWLQRSTLSRPTATGEGSAQA